MNESVCVEDTEYASLPYSLELVIATPRDWLLARSRPTKVLACTV